jgi:enoyl-CoA hydratase
MALDPSTYHFMTVDIRDGIAYIEMNRPERMNACDAEDHEEFPRVLREIAADRSIEVAVLHGAGRAFSVGATYEWMVELTQNRPMLLELQDQVRELVRAHIDNDKPIVAAINGFATGSGLMFALLSDWIVMEEHARIADGHVQAALAAGDGGTMIWPLAVGITRAKRYLMTGDWIDAQEAERIGLVTELVPTGMSLARATEVAERFKAMPQQAVRSTKRSINQWLSLGSSTSFELSAALEMQSFDTMGEDVRAAVAFLREQQQRNKRQRLEAGS